MRSGFTALFLAALLSAPAQADEPPHPIAQLTHDFNGAHALWSYPAVPAPDLRGFEELLAQANPAFRSTLKSQSTIFTCLWRDLDHVRPDGRPPTTLFLSCSFAPGFVEEPKSFDEAGEMFRTIDRANIKAIWQREGESYRRTRFDVELQAGGEFYYIASAKAGATKLEVTEAAMSFPQTPGDEFAFSLSARISPGPGAKRRGSGGVLSITTSGRAEPTPDWVSY